MYLCKFSSVCVCTWGVGASAGGAAGADGGAGGQSLWMEEEEEEEEEQRRRRWSSVGERAPMAPAASPAKHPNVAISLSLSLWSVPFPSSHSALHALRRQR